MIYRLLALNIDGTLLQTNGKIHKSTKEAIEYVQQKGIYVTLVTSRSFPSAKKVAKALKIKSPLITHQGAFIASSIEKPVYVKRINEDITYDTVRFLEGLPCQIRLVHEQFSIANKFKLNNQLIAKTIFTSGDPVFYSQQFVSSLSEYLHDQPVTPPKMEVYFEDKNDLLDAKQALSKMYTEINIIELDSLRLDIVPAGVSKLDGLSYLGSQLGIRKAEMVYIGDGIDDIPLIEAVGLGVSMWNADFEVKKASDWVTRSENEQGVAYMVKEHFRKQQPIEFLRKMKIIKN
ncbi:Cof subfamily protein (haloacid dehalogenase superfamily) [Bacillus sp. SORGH_AS 510]|uniref:Cof-type HAD-IIB family hydrolase n=1 Tax=Bacillus sp. SORGH_AS_0510 TaxID=3041771 RepID=UPI00278337A7|nr:Cof-type HAD-IIB family hydrolase [Bacillus sp. SORGH_AS_0510]MDQ1147199.1 Cof subfamily protein (haloacid dehalogenase superfamily) [Bacillus sp. SORGH_AS_0510]